MRNRLTLSAADAIDSIVDSSKTVKPEFTALFTKKITALAHSSDADDQGHATETFYSYLHHKSKARGVDLYVDGDKTSPNEILLRGFCRNVLDRFQVKLRNYNKEKKSQLKGNEQAKYLDESIYSYNATSEDGTQYLKELNGLALTEADFAVLIDEAIFDEQLEAGAIDTISHKIVDTTAKARSRDNIVENYILSGTGPDLIDNGLATPVSRIGKLATWVTPATSGFADAMNVAYSYIMYGFFAAMILYVLQLPALYIYRRFIKADKNASVSKVEVTMATICTLIAILTGLVVFIPAAVVLLYPFVIALFSLALLANVIGLGLLLRARHTTTIALNASLGTIQSLQLEIKNLKAIREKIYSGQSSESLAAINANIAAKSAELKIAIEKHQAIKVSHEDAHSSRRLRYAIVGTIIAAVVLGAFIASVFCPPLIALIAVVVSATLGTIGIGMTIAKLKHKFNLDVKSRRENVIGVDLTVELDTVKAPEKAIEHEFDEGHDMTAPLLVKVAAPSISSRDGLFGVDSRKSEQGRFNKLNQDEDVKRRFANDSERGGFASLSRG